MPHGFNQCRKNGGKVRTIKKGKDKYQHICILNGRVYPGEIKNIKKDKK